MARLQHNGWDVLIDGDGNNTLGLESASAYDERFHVTERSDTFTNKTGKTAIIKRILSEFKYTGDVKRLIYQESKWCGENRHVETDGSGELHISSRGFRTTQDFNPFVTIDSGTRRFSLHILPAGDWEINVIPTDNGMKITMGLKTEGLSFHVKAGEKVELPVILMHESANVTNKSEFQMYLNNRFPVTKTIPLSYNSWFYDFDKFKVSDLKEQAKAASELGLETFIVDAGWYGPSNDDWSLAAGDWREKTSGAFYGKMKEFSDYIHSLGMGFGLWVEAEKVCSGVPIHVEKPDLFINASDGINYPDLALPAGREYLYNLISSLIDTYNADWLKMDFNFSLENDPHGTSFYLYANGLRDVMKKLRTNYPDVIFENCESGALRADIGINGLFDIQFLSDSVRPSDILRILSGALRRFAPARILKWVVLRQPGSRIPEYGKQLDFSRERLIVPSGPTWNRFESIDITMAGCLALLPHTGFSGDLAKIGANNRETLKEYIEIYKKLRPAFKSITVESPEVPEGWYAFLISDEKREPVYLLCFRLESPLEKINVNIAGTGTEEISLKEKHTACYRLIGNA